MTNLQELKRLALAFQATKLEYEAQIDIKTSVDLMTRYLGAWESLRDFIGNDPNLLPELIDRLERAERAQVPAEWKAVPVAPTENMLKSGVKAFQTSLSGKDTLSDWLYCYNAMIAAAPPAPIGIVQYEHIGYAYMFRNPMNGSPIRRYSTEPWNGQQPYKAIEIFSRVQSHDLQNCAAPAGITYTSLRCRMPV